MSSFPVVDNKHKVVTGQLSVPPRLLLGPGPCNAHPRVLAAMSTPLVGHLDPFFIHLMNETQDLLRYVWQTDNAVTVPVSGTGSAAMEAAVANLIEEGDIVLIGVNGYFGLRLQDMAERYRGDVRTIHKPWGEVFSLEELRAAVEKHRPKILALIHAETSTGACQPLEGVGDLCREFGAYLIADTVTSVAGVPVLLDQWKVDVAYSGGQKCLSCPPGCSPLTFSPRAMEKLNNRKGKVPNWYLDVTMVGKYWGTERTYHHTAPISMNYALREALRIVAEEGLEASWARHRRIGELLWAGLEQMGLKCLVKHEFRLPEMTTVLIPEDVDGTAVIATLREQFHIEISGSLGELKGRVWRIGFMGYNAREENVVLLLAALKQAISMHKKTV